MSELDVFDYFAFVVMGVLFATVVIIIVVIGGLPGRIATLRKHPQATAITAAGWISLITLGALWPIAFVWAFIQPRLSNPANDGGSDS
jgi:hypothetical protein